MSCNGCRVLRKGCSEDCTIRPCLQWITSPEAQANATLFLAKFFGRTGLVNLINAAPQEFRAATFKSLLYEACGRIVNPVYGSMGLMWMGEWAQCEAAVDAVMMGSEISQIVGCNIRHVSRVESGGGDDVTADNNNNKKKRKKVKAGGGKVIKPEARVGGVDWSKLWKSDGQEHQNQNGNGNEKEAVDLNLSLAAAHPTYDDVNRPNPIPTEHIQ